MMTRADAGSLQNERWNKMESHFSKKLIENTFADFS